MNQADVVFQNAFLSEMQRLENGGSQQTGVAAIDKLASAYGFGEPTNETAEAAPAAESATTYEDLLGKLAAFPMKKEKGEKPEKAEKAKK